MTVEVKREDSDFSLYVNGTKYIDHETMPIVDNVAFHLNNPQFSCMSECGQTAQDILEIEGAN